MTKNAALVLVTTILALFIPTALACSACLRDVIGLSEFDQRSWDNAQNVCIGLVTKAELSLPDNDMPTITYTLEVEEVFKGDPETTAAVQSRRTIRPWHREIEEWVCGLAEIFVGDRLIIFSNPDQVVYVGTCSPSRLFEGLNSLISAESAETLQRLRSWADDPDLQR